MARGNQQNTGSNLLTAGLGLTEVVQREYYRGRSADGIASSYVMNTTMSRTLVGRWDIVFAAPHPDGVDYTINVTAEEQSTLRDTPDITVVQGSVSAAGFSVQITTGDNGGAADGYVDTPWSFDVSAPVELVVAGAGFEQAQEVKLNASFYAAANFAATDIHNNGAVVNLTTPQAEGGWAQGGNTFTYAGSPVAVKAFVNLNAPDAGASSYWARPKLRVVETVSGMEWIIDDLVMQQTGAYDGDCTYASSLFHLNPPANPQYELQWFNKENRTATLIPSANSQIVFEAVERETTYGVV